MSVQRHLVVIEFIKITLFSIDFIFSGKILSSHKFKIQVKLNLTYLYLDKKSRTLSCWFVSNSEAMWRAPWHCNCHVILKETDCGSNDGSSGRSMTFQTGEANPERGAQTYSFGKLSGKIGWNWKSWTKSGSRITDEEFLHGVCWSTCTYLWQFEVREGATSLYRTKTIWCFPLTKFSLFCI